MSDVYIPRARVHIHLGMRVRPANDSLLTLLNSDQRNDGTPFPAHFFLTSCAEQQQPSNRRAGRPGANGRGAKAMRR